MRRTILFAALWFGVLLAGFTWVTPAQAKMNLNDFARAVDVAQSAWGNHWRYQHPCMDNMNITISPLETDAKFVATTDCKITMTSRNWSYRSFCTYLVQAYGFVTGHTFSKDRRSPMHHSPRVYPACMDKPLSDPLGWYYPVI